MSAAAVPITFFHDVAAKTKREGRVTLPQLAELIRTTSAPEKGRLPWLKFAIFNDLPTEKDCLRWDGNVRSVAGLEADYDGEKIGFDEAVETLEKAGVEAIIYTSPSHTDERPRWRVGCPFSCELPPVERSHMMGRLNGLFRGVFSVESWTLSQSYYFGSVDHNPAHQVAVIEGVPIDQCHELDKIWLGKSDTLGQPPGGNGQLQSGPLDETALREAIISGAAYHESCTRLVGRWAQQGVAFLGAQKRLLALFDAVFHADRDQRWKQRRSDVPRIVRDIYGKEAAKQDKNGRDAEPPPDFDQWAGAPLDDEGPLLCEPLAPHCISSIPPRPWAYGYYLLFQPAAVLGAVDGGGKGAMAVVVALSMITGRALLGEKVWRTGPVAIITYEDDQTEWSRRIAAACLHYQIDFETVVTGFHFIHRPGSRVCLAAQSIRGGLTFPDGDAIIARLKTIGAVMLIVDPFNLAHALDDGNNNVLIAKAASEATRIAAAAGTAVLVLHHLRKGSTGDPDDLMGAVALRANFRSCRILRRMTGDDAKSLEVPQRQAWRYIRIAGTKENYAPPSGHATWFRLESVALGNPDDLYTEGDNVQVTTTWTPPSAFAGIPLTEIADIFDRLRQPPGEGLRWSPDRRSGEWVGNPIAEVTGKDAELIARIISGWVDTVTLIEGDYKHPKTRQKRNTLTLNEAKAAEILSSLYTNQGTE